MPTNESPTRREFLGTVLRSTVAGTAAAVATRSAFGQVAAPKNVRRVPNNVIRPSDLTWLGAWQTPNTFAGDYSRPCLALRYVGGERRFIFVEWKGDGTVRAPLGDLVEMKGPANPTLYTGTDMRNAQPMIETRRWAAADWVPAWVTPESFPQGAEPGALYWDEGAGLLWFSVYGPYSKGVNTPTWGALQLLDTVKSGNFRNVGATYGPWYYRLANTSAPYTYARQVNQWIVPVPTDRRALVGGAKFLIGAGHTGFNGDAPWGPNLHVLADLTSGMTNPVPLVKALAEYSPESPLARRGCRRDGSHYHPSFTGPGPYQNDVIGGEGTWYGGPSNVKGVVWADTGTKHGVVMFGAEGQGGVGYWHANPKGDDPYPWEVDPTLPLAPGNSPKATERYHWLRIFNPDDFAEVFAGTRCPYADTYNHLPGMRYAYEVNMRTNVTNGSNIPAYYTLLGNATLPRIDGPSTDAGGAVWDPVAKQIIWMQYGTAPGGSVLSFFSVS